ncbi:MAG: phytoene desaturase family protein [Candidatus Cryptobacteroides sp.]
MKSVIVIGAGVAGLTAAICCAAKGHKVCVLEQGTAAGGMSTSWERKGFHFEGGIHWLVGSTPGMRRIHRRWKQVGALRENNPLVFKDPIYVYRCGDVELNLWRDLSRVEREMTEFAPEDRKAVRKFCRDIRLTRAFFCTVRSFPDLMWRVVQVPAFICALPGIIGKTSDEYSAMFTNRHLRMLVNSLVDRGQNAISLVYTMASYAIGDNGYPKGGSTRMVQNMLEKAKALGVEIRYRKKVDKVRVEDGRVRGVVCEGDFLPSDDVIVATDTVKAVNTFFDGPLEEKWTERLKKFSDPQTCMFLSVGVEDSLENHHEALRFGLERPLELAGTSQDCLWTTIYHDTTGYAEKGCSCITVILFGDSYSYWKKAKEDGTYKEKKQEVTDAVIAELERHLPEIKGKIRVTDLATPLTYERYCGTHRGAWMSMWHKGELPMSTPKTARSVKGLHFAGFRTQLSGGLPVALNSGFKAASGV